MQSNLTAWYKIIDTVRPEESVFEKRQLIIQEITKLVTDASDWDTLAACIVGSLRGFDVLGTDTEFAQSVLGIHQSHLLSFPPAVSEGALELRIASSIVIEEILGSGEAAGETSEAEIAAPLILSALGLAKLPDQMYLGEKISQLKYFAEAYIDGKSKALRTRQPVNLSKLSKIALPPDQQAWTDFLNQIQGTFQKLESQMKADREELEILWWSQNGVSRELNRSFTDISIISAAIHAGMEAAEMSLLPPLLSTIAIVDRLVAENRSSTDLKSRPVGKLLSQKDIDTWQLLVPKEKRAAEFVAAFPSLFPLSWLGIRLQESRGNASWDQEFISRTGLPSDGSYTPIEIGEQIFRERIALRTFEEHLE